MNPNTISGVLTDTDFLLLGTAGGKRTLQSIPVPPQVSNLSTLFQQAVLAGLSSIWVMPGTRFSRDISLSLLEEVNSVWEVAATSSRHDSARPVYVQVWRKLPSGRQGPILSLTFPEYAGWDWQLPDAAALLATLTYLEHILGVTVSYSPQQLALDLLKNLTIEANPSWTCLPTIDLRTLPTRDGQIVSIRESAQPLVWMRPLTITEWRMKYLHKYEHNELDLEACTEAQLGIGNPLYSANGRSYDGKLPGIWRIKVETAGSIFDGKHLPSCHHGQWMSTPEVKCCADIAYSVEVMEGYYWPESHRALGSWATTLSKAHQRLTISGTPYRHTQARTNASHTISAITQLTIEKLIDEEAPTGLYRPDWWAQIIGQSRANMFAHLGTLVRRGSMPVLIDKHALWFVSNDPNPLTAVPGLPTLDGGFKTSYSAPLVLSREIKEAFRTMNCADQLAQMLNAFSFDVLPSGHTADQPPSQRYLFHRP